MTLVAPCAGCSPFRAQLPARIWGVRRIAELLAGDCSALPRRRQEFELRPVQGNCVGHTCTDRSRSELMMTETLDRLIAAAAIIGESISPVKG